MQLINSLTQVVNVPPDIPKDKFIQVLKDANSPALSEAAASYDAIIGEGVSPAFVLSCFFHESRYATDPNSIVVKFSTCNPGNCRSSTIGTMPLSVTARGVFVKYPDWQTGFRDLAHRLVKPDYVYVQEGRRTIEQIITRFAPASDNNNTAGYIVAVVSLMNKWIGEGRSMKDPTTRIRLIPGHAGRGRAGAKPQLMVMHVQEGANDLYPEFLNRPAGREADCTIWSKQDGTLDRLLYDSDSPWTNGDVSEPDMNSPIIAGLVRAGVDNTNAYSYTIEHQGFASIGFTDAQIEGTSKMVAYWCSLNGWVPSRDRVVGHYQVGSHKNCPGPKFPFDRVIARAKEILANGGGEVAPDYTPIADYVAAHGGEAVFGKPTSGVHGGVGQPGSVVQEYEFAHLFLNRATGEVIAQMRDPNIIVKNGFQLGHGMLEYWNKVDLPGVPHPLGLPLSNEKDWTSPEGKKFVVQVFERAVLGYDGSIANPPYRVQGLLIGHDWGKQKGLIS
jgi:hypothetical protein